MKLDKKKIPQNCGVYFFRDKRGRILYIGKAVNLRNRIKSYFSNTPANSRIAELLNGTTKITWQKTESEIEALILESRLIKKHRPPFNIMLRDDKRYFYVGFTQDKFPKVVITHRPTGFPWPKFSIFNFQFSNKSQVQNPKFKNLTPKTYNLKPAFIGPFTDGSALKTTLRLLRRIFPYCTCKQKHNNYCLNYHIGKCLGFCCLKNKESRIWNLEFGIKSYNQNIKAVKEILSGKRASLIKKFKKEMANLGKAGKFEEAIGLRDKIMKLEKVFENARIIQNIKYKILNSHQKAIAMGCEYDLLTELQNVLDLPNLPHRIEGYDVSNMQGQFATGVMSVFTDGRPDKSQYRKFKIKLSNEPNDIAMLKEVLTRRFNHPEWPWPDLIIIDGGKAQLNIAIKIISVQIYAHRKSIDFAMTKNSTPIIALTKDKRHLGSHIYLWSSQGHRLKERVISLKKLPDQVKNLILQVDAEAHRFAIGYYRKLHKNNLTK